MGSARRSRSARSVQLLRARGYEMKREVHPAAVVGILVVVLALAVFAWSHFGGPAQPTTKYTPGVPPWMQKGAAPYNPMAIPGQSGVGPAAPEGSGPTAPPSRPASHT